jgi:DNA repair protein RecO (recombination protein O)
MPLHAADALILRTYKLGEADRIVVFLTADRGKRRGVAKGARRTRSPFSGALEPMTLGRLAYFERERRELVRLRYVEPVCSPLASGSAEALAHVGYFAELIDEWAPEADPNEKLFRLGAAVMESLAAGVPIDRLARYFEFWLLRLQGVYPPISACSRCGGALSAGARLVGGGTLVCVRCASPDEGGGMSAAAMAFLAMARTIAPGGLGDVELPPPADRELARAHHRLVSVHLEKDLKSLRVLQSLTRGLSAGG